MNYWQRLICLLLAALLTMVTSTGIVSGMDHHILSFLAAAMALTGFIGINPLCILKHIEIFEIKK